MPDADFIGRDFRPFLPPPQASDRDIVDNLASTTTPQAKAIEPESLGIASDEETKAPPLVAVVKRGATEEQFRLLLDQVQKTQDPEEKAKLVRSAMELIGKQSEKVIQLIQDEQTQIQGRKDSTDEADAVFKLAAAAVEAKIPTELATTIASSPDALATGVVLTLRLAEIGKVRNMAQAKKDELSSLQAMLADHPTDAKLLAKIDTLKSEIAKLSEDANAKARSLGMDTVKFSASVVSTLLGDILKSATSQSLASLGAATLSGLIDIVVLLDSIATRIGEIKKVSQERDQMAGVLEKLKASHGNESLIQALELKLSYLDNMKRTMLIGNMLKDGIALLGKAQTVAASAVGMFTAKVAAILSGPVGWTLTGATLALTLTIFLETGGAAEIEAAMKRFQVTWEETLAPKLGVSPTSHHQEFVTAMEEPSAKLQISKKKLEDAYSKETKLNEKISSLQTRLQNPRISNTKRKDINQELAQVQKEVTLAKEATDQAKEAHHRIIQQISYDDLAGISKVAKVALRLSRTKEEKLADIEEERYRGVEATRLGVTVQEVNEFRATLKNEVLANYQNFTAFKEFFQKQAKVTGISPETFRDDPTEAVMQFLFT